MRGKTPRGKHAHRYDCQPYFYYKIYLFSVVVRHQLPLVSAADGFTILSEIQTDRTLKYKLRIEVKFPEDYWTLTYWIAKTAAAIW